MTRPTPIRSATRLCLVALASLGLAGCYIDTQQFPGFLRPATEPLPKGELDTFPKGPEEAFVTRHTDSVEVRMAESLSTIRLRWYDKRIRAASGSWIFVNGSGKAEVQLPGGVNVVMRGRGAGVVGSESRREPDFFFMTVTRATVTFLEPGVVQLPGGALLESGFGKYTLELLGGDVLRVANRSGDVGRVSYRDDVMSLQPAKSVDLALLDVGTAPFEVDPASRDILSDGGRIELRGEVDVLPTKDGARLRAGQNSEIKGYGLVLRLDQGQEVVFEGLGSPEERRAAAEAALEGAR